MSNFISLPLENYLQAMRKLEKILKGQPGELKEVYSLLKCNHIHSCVCQSVRPSSFSETVREVEEQIEAGSFTGHGERADVGDICRIIAETLIASPALEDGKPRMMKINGAPTDISIVQEVFQKLTHAHVELVIGNFHNTTAKIYNKRSYLQTALYNSVLELDLHYTNQYKHDFFGQ